jgi:hypothetical protein
MTKQTGKRKRKKLTKEQKKAIWEPSKANAGAGWDPRWDSNSHDPIQYETGKPRNS